jgi:hypothetical protein
LILEYVTQKSTTIYYILVDKWWIYCAHMNRRHFPP